ncbi:MAG: hypothetical protein HYY76_00675 [Acidobacteria bacterium]|nr:hypothetical protein [Acidobacteriota bacterium]
MRTHRPGAVVVVAVLAAGLGAVTSDAQTRAFRTPWGDPDLQGVWSNQTLTPLERPAEFAGKTHLTEAEAAAYQARLRRALNADNREPGTLRDVNTAYNDFWWDRGDRILPDRRTSLVIDPPDGKVPAMTPAGKARVAAEAEANRRESDFPAGPEDFDVYSRCIIRGALPRLSTGYNNNYQFVQAPGYVAILQEQIHETRIIPLDRRPHIPGTVRQWLGDSRGWWDGDTLVVETTNFTDAARGSTFRGATKNMHLVERFRRVDETTIDYQFTVSDPETWVRPWTVKVPWFRPEGLLYEYACHEGNYGLANTLSAARALEREKQQAQPQK